MIVDRIALTIAIIGGLNWGSIGIFGLDLVAWAFGGSGSALSRVVYTLVGLSALWCVSLLFRNETSEGLHSAAGNRKHRLVPRRCFSVFMAGD